jgi:osomolarity two-component system response regulator SKN7
LIFMDIIMPMFDGVSATACIRVVAPETPIIAMTSNIRQEDIASYFHFGKSCASDSESQLLTALLGMNDVLAKPFTKDGMVRILKKHLTKLLKNPPPPGSTDNDSMSPTTMQPQQASNPAAYANAMAQQMSMAQQMAAANAGHMQAPSPQVQVKFEGTPMPSPTTTSSWHSPSQMQHTSPAMDGGGYMSAIGSGTGPGGMVLTPGGSQRPQYANQMLNQVQQVGTPTMGRMSDIMGGPGDDRPEKRQRLAYGQPQGQYQQ